MSNLTLAQIENIVIDAGVVYIDYGVPATERMLAPTRGGNTFVVEQEIKTIERDGSRGKEKGLRRIITENATLTVQLLNLSQENLKLALPGADLSVGGVITNGDGSILDTDYLTNITLIGETMKSETKVITLYNALADNGLSVSMTAKEESVVELQFSAHYDPTDLSSPIYKIEEVPPAGTFTVTFTVTNISGGAPLENASVTFYGATKLTNVSGVAAFANVAVGINRPWEIAKGGFTTRFGSVDVDGNEAVAVALTAI